MGEYHNGKKITIACTKCGKPAVVDKEKSTSKWTVYKMDCECGGRCAVKITEEGMEQ